MLVKAVFKYVLLVVLSVVLSMTTVIFGALPMRALRKTYGRAAFWTAFVLISFGIMAFVSPSYGLLILSMSMMIGVYSEIEEQGRPVFTSGFVAALAAIGTTVIGVALWIRRTKISLVDSVREQVTPLVDKLVAMNGNASVSVDAVVQQLPSGMVIGLITALAIALMGEGRLLNWLGEVDSSSSQERNLSSFRVPDLFVWLAIAAIFGAFFRHGNTLAETISLNVLNILVVVFFFQGLAVVAHAFRTYRVSPFWQGLWYIVLVIQLFLLVSLVGFVDFWMEFRERLSRKPAETNKGF